MDINPDQMLQLGQISEESTITSLLNRLNQIILKSADSIITLDEYMAKRIKITKDVSKKISVITPWPGRFRATLKISDMRRIAFEKNMVSTINLSSCIAAIIALQPL